jgi:pilus assembly protein Flp/PilA
MTGIEFALISERKTFPICPRSDHQYNDLIARRFTQRKEDMIKRFLRDETGLELSEYAVAAALVALACVTAFTNLGAAIATKIGLLATKINP